MALWGKFKEGRDQSRQFKVGDTKHTGVGGTQSKLTKGHENERFWGGNQRKGGTPRTARNSRVLVKKGISVPGRSEKENKPKRLIRQRLEIRINGGV